MEDEEAAVEAAEEAEEKERADGMGAADVRRNLSEASASHNESDGDKAELADDNADDDDGLVAASARDLLSVASI